MMGDPGFPGDAMDVEKRPACGEEGQGAGPSSVSCSICLELVSADPSERSIAKLQCGHEFHLDCIGSAFNAKGVMQCPNCRKVEKGRWLYANGYRSFSEFNVEDLVNVDLYDLSYSEMPFVFHWCPFRGFTQLASFFEEGEIQAGVSDDDLLRSASSGGGDSGARACPYPALHRFHPAAAPANPADTLAGAGLFRRHPTGMAGRSSVDTMNPQHFTTEPQRHNWQQQPPSASLSVVGAGDLAARFQRDSGGQQRLQGSFVHPRPFQHGSVSRYGSHAVTSMGSPLMMGEARGAHHSRAHGGHMPQQQSSSSSSSSIRSGAFLPIRRTPPTRTRRVAFVSSVAATSSAAEAGGFYGFSLTGSASGGHRDGGENPGSHFDRVYGWGTPLPWVPVEGDHPQWWSHFRPGNQHPRPGSGDSATTSRRRSQRGDAEGGLPHSGYQQIPLLRMPPFM